MNTNSNRMFYGRQREIMSAYKYPLLYFISINNLVLKLLRFIIFGSSYKPVYKPLYTRFEETFHKIALRNPFYFNLKKVVLRCQSFILDLRNCRKRQNAEKHKFLTLNYIEVMKVIITTFLLDPVSIVSAKFFYREESKSSEIKRK